MKPHLVQTPFTDELTDSQSAAFHDLSDSLFGSLDYDPEVNIGVHRFRVSPEENRKRRETENATLNTSMFLQLTESLLCLVDDCEAERERVTAAAIASAQNTIDNGLRTHFMLLDVPSDLDFQLLFEK